MGSLPLGGRFCCPSLLHHLPRGSASWAGREKYLGLTMPGQCVRGGVWREACEGGYEGSSASSKSCLPHHGLTFLKAQCK